jgi:DNA-binding XRE family transcriptional regulator
MFYRQNDYFIKKEILTEMNIGEALKETRKRLHLSQTEMAGNVLTKSYYSKIERGIHEINGNCQIFCVNRSFS